MSMDLSIFLTEQLDLFELSYPSRCWAFIREMREYEPNRMSFDPPDFSNGFISTSSILSRARVLVYEYVTSRAPHLCLIASRMGTVPYTLRVTLFMLLIACSKLHTPHIISHEAQLEGIIDTFVGNTETQQLLRTVLEQASSYRAFDVAPKDTSISYFYTEIFCSLLNRTPELLYPGAIDTLRTYFANMPVEPPVYQPGQPVFEEEGEYLSLESVTSWERLFSVEARPQPSSSFSWPQSYYKMVHVITTPAPTQTSFELAKPIRFRDEVVDRPEKSCKPNRMGIVLTPLHPFRT